LKLSAWEHSPYLNSEVPGSDKPRRSSRPAKFDTNILYPVRYYQI